MPSFQTLSILFQIFSLFLAPFLSKTSSSLIKLDLSCYVQQNVPPSWITKGNKGAPPQSLREHFSAASCWRTAIEVDTVNICKQADDASSVIQGTMQSYRSACDEGQDYIIVPGNCIMNKAECIPR